MDLWPSHVLGLDNAAGHWYLFHSGIEGQLERLAMLGAVWRHLNCQEPGCWRVGRRHSNHRCHKHTDRST